ncbi:MAG TPA: radical SAM protein [bacterium]|nr:radical SAM protein [bacterium]HPN36265.1 radical SAM protein [bacterium]
MYQYLFGPVPSRRLGFSLGIDLVPAKTCNLNCIYCECGRTTQLTMERREYVALDRVCEELERFFFDHPAPDYLTFSGSGEPLLHSRAGELVEWMKERFPSVPVAVLTNGTLFTDPQVRRAVGRADVVLPSLDAATSAVFKKINRPHPILQIEEIIEGLVRLRQDYDGRIWLEIFIVPGLNDTKDELSALRDAVVRISPEVVQVNTLDRPGTVRAVRAATLSELQRVVDFWQLPKVEIIARSAAGPEQRVMRRDRESAILETVARRPCTLADLTIILGMHQNEVNKYLGILEKQRKLQSRRQGSLIFYEKIPDR